MVKSAVRIWIGLDVFFFHRSLRNQQAVPHNRTKYQQTTCAMQFSPCLFLHGFCPVFHAERDTYSRLCWPKVFNKVGWYGKNLFVFFVNSGGEKCSLNMDRFGWFFSLTHFATKTSSTTQPHKIPANNLRNAIFTMLVLAWVLFCFPLC